MDENPKNTQAEKRMTPTAKAATLVAKAIQFGWIVSKLVALVNFLSQLFI